MKLSPLASYLVQDGLLTEPLAQKAEQQSKELKLSLIRYLVTHQLLTNEKIIQSCLKNFGIKTFHLENYRFEWLTQSRLTNEIIRRYEAVPLQNENDTLYLGIADPTNRATLDAIAFYTGKNIVPVMIDEIALQQFINTHCNKNHSRHLELSLLHPITDNPLPPIQENTANPDEPIIQFVDQLIQHAIHRNASDVHIEPFATGCRIRYRQDGILYEVAEIPSHLAARVSMRLKVMGKCDIAERRLPQDGRIPGYSRDIRMNFCPTLFGEKIVLRLLNANDLSLDIKTLQFNETHEKIFLEKISAPQGMILVTGPTGSGKTTTLYSALSFLNSSEKNISTVEDPIEIQLKGINQVNIQPKIGLHFATALRTLLRQDPDILMIGEIRDTETAEIATQAALTGHLVLSTLHTTHALDAIIRLQSMGLTSYHILTSLSLVVAQRLLRKLCDHCKKSTDTSFYTATGCKYCLHGYQGRIAIYELLPITETFKKIFSKNSPHAMDDYLQQQKLPTLYQSGLTKVYEGVTSMNELNRVLYASQ